MAEEDRPDPEALLQAIKQQETKSKGGKLKIFFGMSAGVGKTYAMLQDAQARKEENLNVAIGIISTHGRKDTAALTQGLTVIPEKSINYKGTTFTELDLESVIKKRPQIVLIDELAHTNVPGSRHPKRWQDVLEILDAGIDVYTTLNVQHIESRKDVVEEITGITIRETVPDVILERASQIELVDITPTELLKRLKEGKVYLGKQSEIAAKNFFQVDKLTALREIALRFTAEKVDHDLHGMLPSNEKTSVWKSSEKLMVAVSHSPHSQSLIRTTRRYAFNLDSPWVAIHIDTGRKLSQKESDQLARNLSLARELGAEIISTTDPDIGKALQRVAKQKNVTQIIIGRPQKRFLRDLFRSSNLLDLLSQEASEIDIHVIRKDSNIPSYNPKLFNIEFTSPTSDYWWISMAVLAIAGICDFLSASISYHMVGFIFLLTIIGLSLVTSSGPLILAATLFSIIWGFIFVPSSGVDQFGDIQIGIFLSFFVTSIVAGILNSRVQERENLLRRREEKTQTLYEVVREIATAPSSKELFTAVSNRLSDFLKGECKIFIKDLDNHLSFDDKTEILKEENEKAVATWVFENGRTAGWSTSTLPSVNNLYIPLKTIKEVVGVLAFRPNPQRTLQLEEINLLQTVCQQVANYIERSFTEDRARKDEYMHQVEKIQQTILTSISKEFSNPLHSIKGAARELKNPELAKNLALQRRKIQQIEESSNNLSHIVDNVLAMSKLSLGFLQLNKEMHDVGGLIEACLLNLQKNLEKHVVKVQLAEDIPMIPFDFALMEMMLCNLLINAAEYSEEGKEICISARVMANTVLLSIADEGVGIPADSIHLVFQKFYRVPGGLSKGMGLGLAVVKTIADMHGAKIDVHNRLTGGVEFIIYLPKE